MPMYEHYLLEDYSAVIEQRDLILKLCLNALKDTEEGVFVNKSQYIQELHGAFDILSALNAKKENNDLYARRGWTKEAETIRRNYF